MNRVTGMPRSARGAVDRWQDLTEEDRRHIAAILHRHSGMLERWRTMAQQMAGYGRLTEPQRGLLARLGHGAAHNISLYEREQAQRQRQEAEQRQRQERRERERREQREQRERQRAVERAEAEARRQAEQAQRQRERERERQRRERAAANPRNNWRITLGVSEEASFDEVRAAFRSLVLLHHPDRGGDPELMRELNTAYAKAQRAYQQR